MSKFTDHTGETNTAKNGLKMTIIAYRGCRDMDIQFEDGIIVYNKQYIEFKRGIIKHPTINTTNVKATKKYIGETNIASNGLKITIIAYRRWNDIDIQFEDGTIVKNKSYQWFKKGEIGHPTIKSRQKNMIKHIGETNINNNDIKMTIIAYRRCDNIDIQFENNIIVHNKTYGNFKNGKIAIPNIINNIKLKEFAYKLNDDWYYICSHPTWMEDKILSVKEIYAYQLKQIA